MHKVSFLSLGRDVSKTVTESSFKNPDVAREFLEAKDPSTQDHASEECLRKHITKCFTFIF